MTLPPQGGSQQQDDERYVLSNRREHSYPLSAFPERIRRAIEGVDAALGGGVELAASAALGVVSLVCQEFINVRRGPQLRPTSCSLFLITIAGTGAGKSEIQNRFMEALEAFEREEIGRARSATTEHQDLLREERLAMLRTLQAQETRLLEQHDDLREQHKRLRARADAPLFEIRQPRKSVRDAYRAEHGHDHPSTLEAQKAKAASADAEARLLQNGLNKLERELSDLKKQRRSLMGPTARQLVYGRGSFAGFRNGLQDRCRSAGIVSAEAGGILNSTLLTRNMDAWNDLWGCELYRETYDKREYIIESPRLTLSLMLQPKQFDKFFDNYGENALDNGFLSRTLLLEVPPRHAKLIGGGDEQQEEIKGLAGFHARVRDILAQHFPMLEDRMTLVFQKTAKQYWDSYYNELVRALDGGFIAKEMEGFVRKLPEQAARVAALFHYFEKFPLDEKLVGIPLETVKSAVRLCDWYLGEFQKRIVSGRDQDEVSQWRYSSQVKVNAEHILRTVRKHYARDSAKQQGRQCIKLTYRDVQNANRSIKSKADILAALHYLIEQQALHHGYGRNGGLFVCYEPFGRYCRRCEMKPVATNFIRKEDYKNILLRAQTAITDFQKIEAEVGVKSTRDARVNFEKVNAEENQAVLNEDLSGEGSLLDLLRALQPKFFGETNDAQHPSEPTALGSEGVPSSGGDVSSEGDSSDR